MRFLSLFLFACCAWGQISVDPTSISQSMRQGLKYPRQSTVYPRRQFITVSGTGSFEVTRGGPLGESACDGGPCFSVSPASGTAPATILIDWDSLGAEMLPAGKHSGTVVVSPGATVDITLEVMPRGPFAEFHYKTDYPSGCVNSDALYPHQDTCRVPDEKPAGIGIKALPPGGCYIDPDFGSEVFRVTPPDYNIYYSTISACNSDCSMVMALDSKSWADVFRRVDGTRVYSHLPNDQAMTAWDALNPNVYWRRDHDNEIVKRDLATGKDTTAADYRKVFASISNGGTGDITNDNWWAFWAPKERTVCAVDLNDLTPDNQPSKTYCASYGDIPLPPANIDFVLVSEPDRLGKRYVVMLASPAAAIWSVNASTGRLDFEQHLEEPQRKQNNDNGVCEKGEVCVTTPHSDLGRDEEGNVVLFMEWAEIYGNQTYLVTLQLNKGKDAFRPVEEGGGLRILYPTNINGGTHFGCTAGVCVFSSWSNGTPLPLLEISGATQAQPVEITTSSDHPWNSGDRVLIEGARGNTCVNGIWTVTKLSDRKFFLDGSDCSSASRYSGGGQAATGKETPNSPNRDEVVVLRLSNPPAAYRLLHHRSVRFNDGSQGYWLTPRASLSRDGAYVVYVSNMGDPSSKPSVWIAATDPAAPASPASNCVAGAAAWNPIEPPYPSASTGPRISAVSNGVTFEEGVVPGSWVTIQGTNLAATTRLWTDADFGEDVNLPTELDGVRVNINGRPAYPNYVSAGQLNVVAPEDSAAGPVEVEVINGAGRAAATAEMRQFQPGFYAYEQEGRKYVIAFDANWGLLAKPGLISDITTRGAQPGETITVLGGGFGPADPPTDPAMLVTVPAQLANLLNVYISGVQAGLLWAGQVGSGLYQITLVVPEAPDGDQPIVAEIGGTQSPDTALITIQH